MAHASSRSSSLSLVRVLREVSWRGDAIRYAHNLLRPVEGEGAVVARLRGHLHDFESARELPPWEYANWIRRASDDAGGRSFLVDFVLGAESRRVVKHEMPPDAMWALLHAAAHMDVSIVMPALPHAVRLFPYGAEAFREATCTLTTALKDAPHHDGLVRSDDVARLLASALHAKLPFETLRGVLELATQCECAASPVFAARMLRPCMDLVGCRDRKVAYLATKVVCTAAYDDAYVAAVVRAYLLPRLLDTWLADATSLGVVLLMARDMQPHLPVPHECVRQVLSVETNELWQRVRAVCAMPSAPLVGTTTATQGVAWQAYDFGGAA